MGIEGTHLDLLLWSGRQLLPGGYISDAACALHFGARNQANKI